MLWRNIFPPRESTFSGRRKLGPPKSRQKNDDFPSIVTTTLSSLLHSTITWARRGLKGTGDVPGLFWATHNPLGSARTCLWLPYLLHK